MNLGIIGAGKIVLEALETISKIDTIDVIAIAATKRSEEKLKSLSKKYNIDDYYTDYEKLLDNPNVDTVYVALPNDMHYEVMKKSLVKDKNIICEKPFTSNIDETLEIIELASQKKKIILEALTIRFLPNMDFIKENLSLLGEVNIVEVNYSQYSSRYDEFKKGNILPVFDATKSGGALMDLGVYNINFINELFGRPMSTFYYANIREGIDTSGILTLKYNNLLATSINAKDSYGAPHIYIEGDNGYAVINDGSNSLSNVTFYGKEGDILAHREDEGYDVRMIYEFEEFERIIREKDFEKANHLMESTTTVMEILTRSRKDAGISFPSDK